MMEWLEQIGAHLNRWWAFVTTGRVLAVGLGIACAVIAIVLLAASRTKWGQAKPLTKFVVVSVLAHVWLLMYAIGTPKILPQGDLKAREQHVSVALEASTFEEAAPEAVHQPADAPTPAWEAPAEIEELPVPAALSGLDFSQALQPPDLLPALEPTPMPALPPAESLTDLEEPEPASTESQTHDSSSQMAGEPAPETRPEPPANLPDPIPSDPAALEPPVQAVASTHSPVQSVQQQLPNSSLPEAYRLRQAPNRLELAKAFGADEDTEAAVQAGLTWLARAQSASGGWIAADYGAGTETYALGEYRAGTGAKADTGVSGLALLAFLSAGHTHLEGEHRECVRRGLAFLIDAQMPSGDLSGPKQVGNDMSVLNARMYCHSISTLALAEAFAMTRDAQLEQPLLLATRYSLAAQDPRGGGWRYQPGDPGDLSQFGWQAMALKSVERSGFRISSVVTRRMQRFLDSCAAGNLGGLATYRPRQGRPSPTMTAESLACRLLLDFPLTLPAQHEAASLIMANRPGASEDNVYFWYYATLALFQLQDEHWRQWNQALKQQLLPSQVPAYGLEPGSWEPDRMWGGYGGRVYSTAMSCLCLEVYYRYLPMYQHSQLARGSGAIPR